MFNALHTKFPSIIIYILLSMCISLLLLHSVVGILDLQLKINSHKACATNQQSQGNQIKEENDGNSADNSLAVWLEQGCCSVYQKSLLGSEAAEW